MRTLEVGGALLFDWGEFLMLSFEVCRGFLDNDRPTRCADNTLFDLFSSDPSPLEFSFDCVIYRFFGRGLDVFCYLEAFRATGVG